MRKISLEEFNKNKNKFDILKTKIIDFFDKEETLPRIIELSVEKNEYPYSNDDLKNLIVNKNVFKNYLKELVEFFEKKTKENPNVMFFWKFMSCEKSVENYPDWKPNDTIIPKIYIMSVTDLENGLYLTKWHKFVWDYRGNHSNIGLIKEFSKNLSLDEVKEKISKTSINFYLKISSETVDILADDIWQGLEKEKMNIKEELEIIPYEKKSLKDLF